MLDITGIRSEDAGRYTCRGEIDGADEEKSLWLVVESKYTLISNAILLNMATVVPP